MLNNYAFIVITFIIIFITLLSRKLFYIINFILYFSIYDDDVYSLLLFTVDLNEEYSGLFGGVLEAQSLFVNHSIHTILNLYDKNTAHPKSIVLIGHSIVSLFS